MGPHQMQLLLIRQLELWLCRFGKFHKLNSIIWLFPTTLLIFLFLTVFGRPMRERLFWSFIGYILKPNRQKYDSCPTLCGAHLFFFFFLLELWSPNLRNVLIQLIFFFTQPIFFKLVFVTVLRDGFKIVSNFFTGLQKSFN